MNNPLLKKILRFTVITCTILLLGTGAFFFAVVQPGGDGVLASLRLEDGSEYLVTQRCNWSAEPYTVAFYMRAAGRPWGWCYIDHEATRWRNVTMTHDAHSDQIVITERGKRAAVLDRTSGKFWIANLDRDVDAPQAYRTPEIAMR